MGVEATAKFAKKPSGCTDTGGTLITDQPQDGVSCKDTKYGKDEC